MTENQLSELIRKYLSGEANEEDKQKVEQWYESFDTGEIEFAKGEKEKVSSMARSWQLIREKIAKRQSEKRKLFLGKTFSKKIVYRWTAAAAVLILLMSTVYFFTHEPGPSASPTSPQVVKEDIQPGGNKAILTLGNGRQIVLDSMHTGLLSQQGNTKVIKAAKGLVAYKYQPSGTRRQSIIDYNTITTPSGGQYEIVLSDGTKVWLNAASSIKFPTAFTRGKREVEINGEAYFEVAKDAAKPFLVKKAGLEVQVLGTHFNLMAYDNEPDIKVTLLEGLVRVAQTVNDHTQILNAGEQVNVAQNGQMKVEKNANVNEAIAWKNKLFWFDNNDIQEVAKQLSRWYGVNITIDGNIPDKFTGSIPMDLPLSKVVGMLQKTGRIQYTILKDKKTVVFTGKK